MNELQTILQRKYARIIMLIAEKKEISLEAAMELFYNSKAFTWISELSTGLYTMSDGYLADEVLNNL